jgi:hypothetical protein
LLSVKMTIMLRPSVSAGRRTVLERHEQGPAAGLRYFRPFDLAVG